MKTNRKYNPEAKPVADAYDDADVERLEDWFRNVLPNWRDINPERIIKQAHQEVQNGLQYNHPCAQL